MQLHTHQTLSAIPIIPFAGAGIVTGAFLARWVGLTAPGGDPTLELARWALALVFMLAVGWVCSLPVQFAYDRLVPAQCPQCHAKAAYRRWPSIGRYRCRACGADSTA